MEPRVSFVTLAVPEVAAVRAFYVDGLGWPVAFEADDIVMIRVGERLMLSLWSEAGFEAEVGPVRRGDAIAPVTLAHSLPSPGDVDRVLAEAAAAGAHDVRPGQQREWGGYSGYFADPAGFRWEVAYNPGDLGQEVL